METLQFKTNIKCGACIATVTPHLNELSELAEWKVDTTVADKILTVSGNSETLDQQIIGALKNAGYTAEKI